MTSSWRVFPILAAVSLFVQVLPVHGQTDPLPLPRSVVAELGDGLSPAFRKWGLPEEGKSAVTDLGVMGVKTAPERMEPYILPAVTSGGCAGPPTVNGGQETAEDPSRKLLFDGFEALKKGKTDEAAFYFEKGRTASSASPYADECVFWLGETRRAQGKNSEAIVAFEKVSGALKPEALYRLAWLLEKEGRDERVKSAWEKVASDAGNPHRGEAYYRLALLGLKNGRTDRAKEDLERAFALAPPDSDVNGSAAYALAILHRDAGRLAPARKILEKMLLSRPDHVSAPGARVLLGFIEAESGNPKGAAARFEESLLATATGDTLADRARYGLATLAVARGDAGEVRKIAGTFATPSGEHWAARAYSGLGMRLYATGRYEEALAAFEEAVKAGKGNKNCSERYMAGRTLLLLGRETEAARLLSFIEAECPAAPDGWHEGALALERAGDGRGALDLLRKVASLRPDYHAIGQVRVEIGRISAKGGETGAALKAFESVGEESPALADALYGRAVIAFEAERMEEASNLLLGFTMRFPDHPSILRALIMLAKTQARRGSPESALATLEKVAAKAVDPSDRAEARFERGWILMNSGREEEGAKELEAMLLAGGGRFTADAAYSVGLYRYAKGQYTEALARFESVLKTSRSPGLVKLAGRGAADSLYMLGRYAEALKAYKSTGRDREALSGMIFSLGMLGRTDEMTAELDLYARTFPGDGELAELSMAAGDALSEKGRLAEAFARYDYAASVSAGDKKAEALTKSGSALAAAGRLSDAENRFRAAGDLNGILKLAAMWEKEGRREKALAVWDEIARGPHPPDVRADALFKAGTVLAGLGRRAEAEERLLSALKLTGISDSTKQAMLVELGGAALLAGDLDKAIERSRAAVILGEGADGLKAMMLLADALFRSGAAQASLETYLRIGYLYPVTLEQAARAALTASEMLKTAGRGAEARALLKKVAEEGPSPMREEAQSALAAEEGGQKAPEEKPPE